MYIPGLDVRLTARYGLAILRIVLGIAMIVHGWSKLSGGVDNVAGFFGGTLGIPAPGLIAWVVTIVELLGGILLVIGFLTQIAGILIALDMLGAILFAYLLRGAPLIAENGQQISWEREAVFAAAALCIALAGPGAWSVDDVVAENRRRAIA
jgi:putative oxidoreductase